jgi:hypothetical protein
LTYAKGVIHPVDARRNTPMMMKVSLYRDHFDQMDHDKTLDEFVMVNNDSLQQTMTREAFKEFCFANNLIPYKHYLKNYHSGKVYGEFEISET